MRLVASFKDPVTRPRAIMWLAVGLFAFAAFFIAVGDIATCTRWFCANMCHKVQDDTILSYEASAHSHISCVTCHEPVNANPVVFLLAKARSLGEIPPTLTNTFELPLNPVSAYGLGEEMPSTQCTQCHGNTRKITPSEGIIIDHKVHEKEGITCTTCHNRCAHNDEAIKLTLPGNKKHKDYMKMDGCFRCHALEGERRAEGECKLCHPAGFELVPETHKVAGWLPKGHADAARESLTEFGMQKVEAEEQIKEGVDEELAVAVEYCSTCHKRSFCTDCHDKLGTALKDAAPAANAPATVDTTTKKK
ncbi:MAG TPA: multiheme c-type cytochrome [Coriobacteriia bacterium]|nr:multiheme c-type cytochrome [Coriobacteriia bacterium]